MRNYRQHWIIFSTSDFLPSPSSTHQQITVLKAPHWSVTSLLKGHAFSPGIPLTNEWNPHAFWKSMPSGIWHQSAFPTLSPTFPIVNPTLHPRDSQIQPQPESQVETWLPTSASMEAGSLGLVKVQGYPLFKIYFIYFRPCWVFLLWGLFSSCGKQGLLSSCSALSSRCGGSLDAEHGL